MSDVRDGTHESPKYHEEGHPLITSKNLRTDGAIDFRNTDLISPEDFEKINKRSKVDRGDILFGMIGTIGNPVIVKDDSFAIKNVALIKQKNSLFNEYLFQYLKSDYIQKKFYEKNAGGTQKFIALGLIRGLEIPTPSWEEQLKIAEFLGGVEEWLQNLRAQNESLEAYKKGIMQKIFSQEIRFKDENGKDFPAWEEKKLGQVFDFLATNSYSREQLTYVGGEVKNIHYGDIHTKFKTHFNINKEDVPYLTGVIDSSKIKPELFCQEGDVIIADASEDYKDIGKAIELVKLDGQNVVAGLHTLLLRPKKGVSLEVGFAGYLMQIDSTRKQFMKMATGISVLGISKTNLEKVKVVVPPLLEQRKIADFLTSLDNLIESKQQQIIEAETWKKGLMQCLFV